MILLGIEHILIMIMNFMSGLQAKCSARNLGTGCFLQRSYSPGFYLIILTLGIYLHFHFL